MAFLKFLLFLILLLGLVYALGPKTKYPEYDAKIEALNISFEELELKIQKDHQAFPDMLPDNRSELLWFGEKEKTEYSIVYLHGYSASPKEGEPVHKELAKRYGCNIYLARLPDHGIQDREVFANLTPKAMIDCAKEAIAIGQLIGEKVILLSTSTGSTLSTYLTAHNPDLVHSLIMYSPNFQLFDPKTKLAMQPWGMKILKTLIGEYRQPPFSEEAKLYWTDEYRIEGLSALIYLVNETMTDAIFKKIDKPYFIGYWYKNEEEMDKVISIERIKEFDKLTATSENQKRIVPFADVNAHVICSPIMSKDVDGVRQATFDFVEEVLDLPTY